MGILTTHFNRFVICCLLATAVPASAVYISEDGVGQMLIFPYYSTQLSRGDAQNTYLTIVNQSAEAKALRVRIHEAKEAREVGSFNLFLSPGDTWAGAMLPSSQTSGTKLFTIDKSCVSEPFAVSDNGLQFDFNPSTSSLERTREGWLEVIEMSTVIGASAAALAPDASGTPANCSVVAGAGATVSTGPPTGGLSGTFTVINVANGLEFSGNPIALGGVTSTPFYRPASDTYPSLNASEIDPVSVVVASGSVYQSRWGRPVDAISAVLMRNSWAGEFVLDSVTRSRTDVVLTYPTRQFYVSQEPPLPPFSQSCSTPPDTLSGEPVTFDYANREGATTRFQSATIVIRCAASEVFDFQNSSTPTETFATSVLGSKSNAWLFSPGSVMLPTSIQNGRFVISAMSRTITSLSTSTRTDLATGEVIAGAHVFTGLPVVGFAARTFENGTLSCGAGTCQGNYGGAFPLKFTRSISP